MRNSNLYLFNTLMDDNIQIISIPNALGNNKILFLVNDEESVKEWRILFCWEIVLFLFLFSSL